MEAHLIHGTQKGVNRKGQQVIALVGSMPMTATCAMADIQVNYCAFIF